MRYEPIYTELRNKGQIRSERHLSRMLGFEPNYLALCTQRERGHLPVAGIVRLWVLLLRLDEAELAEQVLSQLRRETNAMLALAAHK